MPPDLSDELREEVVLLIKKDRDARTGANTTVFSVISKNCHQRVASQYAETCPAAFRPERIVPPSHGLARGSNGSSAQPEMGKTTFLSRIVNPTRRCSDKGMKVTLEGMLGEMTARPNVALRNFSSVSTKAHCYVALVSTAFSDRLAPRKHQSTTFSNDLCVMHSSSGTMLLDGLFRLSNGARTLPLTVSTAPPLAPLPKWSADTSAPK